MDYQEQQRKEQEWRDNLKAGDEVFVARGAWGKLYDAEQGCPGDACRMWKEECYLRKMAMEAVGEE